MKFSTYAYLAVIGSVSAQDYISPEKRYTAGQDLPECHGTNGPLGINCIAPPCSGTNGPKDGPSGTPCLQDEPADIPHYNTDPTAGRPYGTTGDRTRTETGLGHYPNPPNHADYNNPALASPAPYEGGNTYMAGSVKALSPSYVQMTEQIEFPEPQPIGTLMAQLEARSMMNY